MTTIFNDSKLIHEVDTAFQNVKVFQSDVFGKILTIDDDIQLSESDESHYHEMLVHVPMAYLSDCKTVLIIGGGDGGVVRECCKYSNIQQILLVDIDYEVINVCKQFFPKFQKVLLMAESMLSLTMQQLF